jgi:hypothetical protein
VRGGHKIKPSMRLRLDVRLLKTPHPNPLPQGERESERHRSLGASRRVNERSVIHKSANATANSGEDLFDDPAVDVRQAEVAAGVAVGEPLVIKSQEM